MKDIERIQYDQYRSHKYGKHQGNDRKVFIHVQPNDILTRFHHGRPITNYAKWAGISAYPAVSEKYDNQSKESEQIQ